MIADLLIDFVVPVAVAIAACLYLFGKPLKWRKEGQVAIKEKY